MHIPDCFVSRQINAAAFAVTAAVGAAAAFGSRGSMVFRCNPFRFLCPGTCPVRELRRRIAIVFQNPDDQLFCSNIYEDIAFGPVNHGLKSDEVDKIVQETVKKLKLEGLKNRNPYANLDPKGRREIAGLIREAGGTRIIMTQHLELVKEICSRVIVPDKVIKEAEGNVNEVLSDEKLLYKCGLL